MLLEKDELKEGLSPEQIQAIETAYSEKESELTALANKNADAIFNGAAQKLTELTGIAKSDKEKYSDFFIRLGNEWLPEASKKKIEAAEEKVRIAEEKIRIAEEKFNNHKGDETLKSELQKAKDELAKIPDLLSAKENEWKEKYEELEEKYTTFKLTKGFDDSMPKFDDNVNPFELKAKKQNAIDRIRQTYELSFDDKGNMIGTKDYQKSLVSDLLNQDAELKDLILTDQGQGGGGHEKTKPPTKGLNIPENISKGSAQQIIKEYIINVEKIGLIDEKYSERFKELCKENNVL